LRQWKLFVCLILSYDQTISFQESNHTSWTIPAADNFVYGIQLKSDEFGYKKYCLGLHKTKDEA